MDRKLAIRATRQVVLDRDRKEGFPVIVRRICTFL